MGRKIKIILGAVVVIGVGVGIYALDKFLDAIHVSLPEYQATKKTVWLDQNVNNDKKELAWFYHADQGTRTFGIPLEWFEALEQPVITLTAAGLLSDPAYLDRYGFIPDVIEPGKKSLPIGFASGSTMSDASGNPWRNPRSKKDMTGLGLTCAACHTGRFTYKDTTVIIDGGPALTNLFNLKQGIGVSLLLTRILPLRFQRFAERILGPDATSADRALLKKQLILVLNQYNKAKKLEDSVAPLSIVEGYGRLDALNRIGNQVFSIDLNNPKNYAASSAPVHYPRIWNTPWFDWVQYNGSIMQPMVRNAGEALGVSAELNLIDPSKGLYKSSVQVKTLDKMESMIKGDPPSAEKGFSGLKSPKWPGTILPPIDEPRAAQGAELYKAICQDCHRPPVTSKEFFDFNNKKWWTTNEAGQPIVVVENIPISHVGTDPAQATDMINRTVELPSNLGIKAYAFADALKDVVENTVNFWIKEQEPPPLSDKEKANINGNMPNKIQGELAYKVRSLNGVWATPPYLHNGSVPNIEALLGAAENRPKTFYLGNREYDPVNLGYSIEPLTNGFEFDTSLRGNSNRGHEFTNDEKAYGRVGRALAPDERKALIEYLKTL
ncbi:di-heme-cytochrome C peroxidase [Bradyrhizobium sp. AZCC 2289]|uniref:di-heme-cytochrome C peroxidase n=1 Tax=Bradyrhizobium sp. AZCC 2289 TaxID=3117026 RepID=UPI002FEF23C5